MGWLLSDEENAAALPTWFVSILLGRPISFCVRLSVSNACPSEAPVGKLNETATAGNWSWRVMASGPTRLFICENAASGICSAGLLKLALTPLEDCWGVACGAS